MSVIFLTLRLGLLGLALPLGSALADTLDVFPIREGLQYTYAYWDSARGIGPFGEFNYSQSGTISYRIDHAVPLDGSGIDWEMTEIENLINVDHLWGTTDTLTSSRYAILRESFNGMHSLDSWGYVWRFPVHAGTFMPEITDTVFRFTEVSPAIFRYESQCDSLRIYFDSLWFEIDSGLTRKQWENCIKDDGVEGEYFGAAHLVSVVVTSVDEPATLPTRTRLITNYPNPFNSTTTIAYDLAKAGEVSLHAYDMNGRLVLSVDEGYKVPGSHSIQFGALGISSGVYIIRLYTTDGIQTGRLIYLR